MKAGDRVLVIPLGVAGTVIRETAAGRWLVRPVTGAQAVAWLASELAPYKTTARDQDQER